MHLWLGDERCVPDGDPESNAQMVRESLYAHARAEPPSLHPVPSPLVPEDAAWLYGLEVRACVPDVVFDIVLLGHGARRPHLLAVPRPPGARRDRGAVRAGPRRRPSRRPSASR